MWCQRVAGVWLWSTTHKLVMPMTWQLPSDAADFASNIPNASRGFGSCGQAMDLSASSKTLSRPKRWPTLNLSQACQLRQQQLRQPKRLQKPLFDPSTKGLIPAQPKLQMHLLNLQMQLVNLQTLQLLLHRLLLLLAVLQIWDVPRCPSAGTAAQTLLARCWAAATKQPSLAPQLHLTQPQQWHPMRPPQIQLTTPRWHLPAMMQRPVNHATKKSCGQKLTAYLLIPIGIQASQLPRVLLPSRRWSTPTHQTSVPLPAPKSC